MTILSILSKKLKGYADGLIKEQKDKKESIFFNINLFGPKETVSKPLLAIFLLNELSVLLKDNMSCKEIETLLAIVQSTPEFSKQHVDPLDVEDSEVLEKDEKAVFEFWNRIFTKAKIKEKVTEKNFDSLYQQLQNHFDCTNFHSSEPLIKRMKELYNVLLPSQVGVFERDPTRNCVVSQVTGEFTEEMSKISNKTSPLEDFRRNAKLEGFATYGKSDEEITAAISQFVCDTEDPSIKEQQLITFLLHNGGQFMTRFFQMEIMNSLENKTAPEEKDQINYFISEGTQVWKKDPQTHVLYTDIEEHVYALVQFQTFFINNNNEEQVLEDAEKARELASSKSPTRMPILRCQGRVRLDFNSADHVVPRVEQMIMHLNAKTSLSSPNFVSVSTQIHKESKIHAPPAPANT